MVLLGVGAGDCKSAIDDEAANTSEQRKAERKIPPASVAAANVAQPQPAPAPAPDGAVLLEAPSLYVQTCAEGLPCPKLVQGEASSYCAALVAGALSWRLPTLDEARRFAGAEGLLQTEGFHWTGSAYEEDAAQAWILDPVGGQSTTIPRDRKPFTARCVAEPAR